MTRDGPDIFHTQPDRSVAIAWVNSYSAVVVKTPGSTILFDPVSMEVPEGVSLDLIAVSHGHSDHWDPELVAGLQQRTDSVVVTSPYLASRLSALLQQPGTSSGAADPARIPSALMLKKGEMGDFGSPGLTDQGRSDKVRPVRPGDEVEVGDATVTALRCDHAAVEPLAFTLRTADGVTVYLPGDTTPFPEMRRPRSEMTPGDPSAHPEIVEGPDILVWMGTALEDGARIADLVRPRVMVTYAIGPPAAGERAKAILTRLTPEIPFHALGRHQVFSYPTPTP